MTLTLTQVSEIEVHSQMIRVNSIFVKPLVIYNFTQMQEILGGDCFAIALPHDIILWCSADGNQNPYEHVATIQTGSAKEYIFGNVIITSSDDDDITGIRSLSDEQTKWLRVNLQVVHSELHGNNVLKYLMP